MGQRVLCAMRMKNTNGIVIDYCIIYVYFYFLFFCIVQTNFKGRGMKRSKNEMKCITPFLFSRARHFYSKMELDAKI